MCVYIYKMYAISFAVGLFGSIFRSFWKMSNVRGTELMFICFDLLYFTSIWFELISISVLPASSFENLNSLETLNIQNNKLTRIPEEVMEPIIDTLRVVDIVGKCFFSSHWHLNRTTFLFAVFQISNQSNFHETFKSIWWQHFFVFFVIVFFSV